MPTFEHVDGGDRVTERRHVPYRSRDLPALEASPRWRKVAESYEPATGDEPRPTVEELRAAQAKERQATASDTPTGEEPAASTPRRGKG